MSREKDHRITVGRRLRLLRVQRKMTLKDVATKLLQDTDLDLNEPSGKSKLVQQVNNISRIETAARPLKYDLAAQLALAMDFDISELFAGEEVPLNYLSDEQVTHSVVLSGSTAIALEEFREEFSNELGVSLSKEQVIEYLARNFHKTKDPVKEEDKL